MPACQPPPSRTIVQHQLIRPQRRRHRAASSSSSAPPASSHPAACRWVPAAWSHPHAAAGARQRRPGPARPSALRLTRGTAASQATWGRGRYPCGPGRGRDPMGFPGPLSPWRAPPAQAGAGLAGGRRPLLSSWRRHATVQNLRGSPHRREVPCCIGAWRQESEPVGFFFFSPSTQACSSFAPGP